MAVLSYFLHAEIVLLYSPGFEAFGLHCHLDQARFFWCQTCWSSCSLQEQKEVNWLMFVRTYWSKFWQSHLLHICNVEYVTEVEKIFLLEEVGMDFLLSSFQNNGRGLVLMHEFPCIAFWLKLLLSGLTIWNIGQQLSLQWYAFHKQFKCRLSSMPTLLGVGINKSADDKL